MKTNLTSQQLERRVAELELTEAELTRLREREKHMRRVLLAIREINQLMTVQTDRNALIQRACASMTGTLGYHNVWIALIDEDGSVIAATSAGFEDRHHEVERQLEEGDYPTCMRRALQCNDVIVTSEPSKECIGCPLSFAYDDRSGMSGRLVHDGTVYGVISVSTPARYAQDSEELELFNELAGDLAFALCKIGESEALRAANGILERSPASVFVWKNAPGWPVEFASSNTERVFGWTAQDFISGRVAYSSVVHPDDLDRVGREVADSSADPEARTVAHTPYRIVRRDGTVRWVEDMTVIRRADDGCVLSYEGILLDITQRHEIAEELRKSREQFMLAVKGSNDGIWDWDLQDNSLFLSPRWKEMLGYEDDELPSQFSTFEDNVHPDDKPVVLDHVNRYLSGEIREYGIEFRMLHKDGGYRWILARGQAVRDEKGRSFRMAGSHTDITERKKSEEQLAESKREFEYIFNNSHVGIMYLRGGRFFARGNQRLADILGYDDPDELVGKSMRTLHLSEERFREFGERFYSKLTGGEVFQVEYQLRRKDGTPVWCTLSGKALNPGDLDHGVIWVIDDLEPRKQAEEALLETNRRLEEATARANDMAVRAGMASAAKSDFLANMSHEIRTPLNGVIGMTGLLLDTDLDEEQRRYAEVVRTSGESLLNVINDILDFSKIEAQKLDLEAIDFDLEGLLEDFAPPMALKAHEKGLELICGVSPDTPVSLRGDPGRLRQILSNLVVNAIKFTHEGEVTLRVMLESETDTACLLRFSVRDTGIGIPASCHGDLFQQFTQVDSSTTRRFGGTGLGLAISKQLVEMMNGEIGFVSEEGEGSEFWFTASFEKQARDESLDPVPGVDLSSVRVLIVDDNATSREILEAQLRSWSMRVSETEGGPGALQRLYAALDEDDPFQVAIIDMQMPGMDGVAVGRAIRSDSRFSDLRMVMLTSLGARGDATILAEVGYDGYLPKPVRQRELKDVLSEVLAPETGGTKKPRRLATRHNAREYRRTLSNLNARVLVAEDNPTNQQVALGILKKLGLTADAVADGSEAIEALESIPYDLVLMDVQMPELDGLTATRVIRAPGSAVLDHKVPIIAMTAHAMTGDREKYLDAGMDDYISKPVSPSAIAEALERQLGEGGEGGAAERSGLSPQHSVGETRSYRWDKAAVLDRLMGDVDLAREIMRGFLEDVPEQIGLLGRKLDEGDTKAVEQLVHGIKGAAANAGGQVLAELAANLENAAKAGDVSACTQVFEQMLSKYGQLEHEIEEFLHEKDGTGVQ